MTQRCRSILFSNRRWIILGVAATAVSLGAVGLLVWHHSKTELSGYSELKRVQTEVSRHYLLPSNEVPALATVTDKAKLTTAFFQGSENGDKILIYQKNHFAIIYRPRIDRVVNVGPVQIDAPSKQIAP
jgi:hypothetical protein